MTLLETLQRERGQKPQEDQQETAIQDIPSEHLVGMLAELLMTGGDPKQIDYLVEVLAYRKKAEELVEHRAKGIE